jgi:integration host factor subunit alpha
LLAVRLHLLRLQNAIAAKQGKGKQLRKPKSLGRVGLVRAITRRAEVSQEDAAYLIDAILQHMREALDSESVLKIPNFGTFTRVEVPKRMGRHPSTGTEISIMAQRSVTFRPSRTLKARIHAQARAADVGRST